MGSSLSSFNPSAKISDNIIDKFIYGPPAYYTSTYHQLCSYNTKLVTYRTANNQRVAAFLIKPDSNSTPKKYIIFSHGNGSDIADMHGYCSMLANQLQAGVLIYDYIGYGLSHDIDDDGMPMVGRPDSTLPTEQGCYDSIEASINYLCDLKINPADIYLVGHSLGTGITVDYVAKHNWQQPIILISPYKSICKVVLDSSCTSLIDKFTTQSKLDKVVCPVKIFHGINDTLINIKHGKELYNKLINKALEPVWFENTGHNDILEKITIEHYQTVVNYQI